MSGAEALPDDRHGGLTLRARWTAGLRWWAFVSCIAGIVLGLATLILPWVLVERQLFTWSPALAALGYAALGLLAVGLVISIGLLVAAVSTRTARTDFTPLARWSVAWLCFAALAYAAMRLLGAVTFTLVPTTALVAFLPAFTFKSRGGRVAWALAAAALAWWSLSLASGPMPGGKFGGLGIELEVAAIGVLQFLLAVTGLLRGAFRR